MRKTIGVTLLGALALAAGAAASQQGESYNLVANLKAANEVPKPTGAKPSAVGLFTAKVAEQANGSAKVTWRLTFKNLTGPAAAAHIHLGKPGKAGPVVLALCGPCKSGQKGSGVLTKAQWSTVEHGGGYVNVHTAKNPGGEIRGQVKSSSGKTASSSGYGS
jgi:CHRD domain